VALNFQAIFEPAVIVHRVGTERVNPCVQFSSPEFVVDRTFNLCLILRDGNATLLPSFLWLPHIPLDQVRGSLNSVPFSTPVLQFQVHHPPAIVRGWISL
jgi:hypothetical protein